MSNRIEEGRPLVPEPLSRDELVAKTNSVLGAYGERSIDVLGRMVRTGEGRQVLGSVKNRPEDEELQIDSTGERILSLIVGEHKLPVLFLGEHNRYQYLNRAGDEPYVVFPNDPFDNSSQYKRGLDTPPYTVLGAYHPDGEPIGAVVGDIKDRKVYLAIGGRTFMRDLETGDTKPIVKSERTTLLDDNATLATYLGSNKYSVPFFDCFKPLIEAMPPKALLYGGGGAYIYAFLATGAVDAYIMFDEPRTEIDPGLPLAVVAKCTVVSVNPDGSFEDYSFDQNRHNENVPFFIAACTPEIRNEIIGYYLKAKELQTK